MYRLLIYSFTICWISFSCNNPTPDLSINNSEKNTDSSWALIPFIKIDSVNPIMRPGNNSFECPIRKEKIFWEQKDVFNPAIIVKDGKLFMLYRAQDKKGTSRIGLAESVDGIHFARHSEPVLFPDNDAQKKI